MIHPGAFFIAGILSAGTVVAGGDDPARVQSPSRECHGQPDATYPPAAIATADPAAIVAGFYSGQGPDLSGDNDTAAGSAPISRRLSAQLGDSQRAHDGFALTFDPIVNGQDALITGLVVHPTLFDGDRAYVNARFRNFDADNALLFSFVWEQQAWRLDEIASIGGDMRWVLSDVLENP